MIKPEVQLDALQNQRERILNAFLGALPIIGTVAYMIAIPSTFENKDWVSAAIYTLGWLVLSSVALLRKKIPYIVKTGSMLVLIYVIAVQSIPTYGFASGIQGWLLTLTVFSIIFLGNKGGYAASFFGAATMGAGGAWVLLSHPLLSSEAGSIGTPTAWSISTVSYLAISIGVTIILSNLLNALQSNLTDKERLTGELSEKNIGLSQNAALLQEYGQQLQKRASRLQAITELSEAIALIQDPEELLPLIVRTISERFSFYHVGIFLLDEKREYAVLKSANSEGGQRMLERSHKLKVGSGGLVGFSAQTGLPRLALDTGADAIYFNNPDLPETHSEVALPLKVGQEVIGVLDVQSAQSSAFDNEDVKILGSLANQVAIVIQNSRLFEETRSALKTFNVTGQKMWAEHAGEGTQGYSYRPDGSVVNAPQMNENLMRKALASNQTVVLDPVSGESAPGLAIPVKLRDQVIGIIHIEATEANRKWSESEIAMVQSISERAALALENARLFENAQRRANREQVISEVTAKIGATTNVDAILRSAVLELGRQIGKTEVTIEIGEQVMDKEMEA